MFAPLGLFKGITCPGGAGCGILNCIFLHQETKVRETQQVPCLDTKTDVEPLEKKRKLVRGNEEPVRKRAVQSEQSRDAAPKEIKDLVSARRKVSPPPARPATTSPSLKRKAPKESLNPRLLKKAPATHPVRSSILLKLHGAMKVLNEKMAKLKDLEKASLVLTPDELVVMALDEEQKTATENSAVYSNVIKLRIVKLSRMSLEEWEKEVVAHLNARYYKIQAPKPPQPEQRYTTNLTEEEEIEIARMLRTEIIGKEQYGYITKIPTEAEIAEAKRGIEAADGWEKCDRCAGRFQVFPGRRADGTLATGGKCTYHPGKVFRPPRKPTDHITGGQAEAYFPCCNETVGTSAGCTKAEHHVFKVSDPKRLAAVMQFEKTPARDDDVSRKPVTFDCEMGYTTLGMELIRLTALSWPKGDTLLDVLVKPIGEILDLNSRYSGVFPEHFVNAVPYSKPPQTKPKDVEETAPMQVVDSPAAARSLLFELIDPSTPLIGHAIDNDLNVVRIIHPTIIDTVLLYPHPRGLPVRYSLKYLSKLHLERDIQMGGANKGHDSREDALATGDLVRVKVVEKASVLKLTSRVSTFFPPSSSGSIQNQFK
ncbi:RNA exonuclease Rex3, putative [Talaromyces stipitatus ATCC 10500]|uniref:RNA exonuclease Rex3, putative n=1 Tax=Talaromyces stipitatus (strain ATCC 10500 / CBS 375.48 / QM 6759 / NRRL 1006) TaxID=441959 RepID=B8MPF2_TALSN|nr:RNA exonuclease Rex3, putative [Talaromyces stipitatus ATCC 10500]EED14391.1 RNA exonuclease Rex3, putative [Talaromyces stipitatus ATCC 10500]